MRIIALTCIMIITYAHTTYSQNVDAFLNVDAGYGYTSNTFLNPFINEWNRSDFGGYASISPSGQLLWNAGKFSGDLSTGYVYQPLFDGPSNWSGFYGNSNVRYRLSSRWMTEVQVSGSQFSSSYDRSLFSVLPSLTWSPTFFTRIRARAGSSFRNYSYLNADVPTEFSDRLDLYGLEIETWPSFNWRVKAGFNGNFNENLVGNHTLSVGIERIIKQNWRFSLQAATDRYSTEVVTTTGGTGGGGMPPIGGPPSNGEETIVEDSDRLIRTGISLSRTFFERFTATASVSNVQFLPADQESTSDIQTALNLRYTFPVSGLSRSRDINPKWSDEGDGVVFLNVNYRGDGNLYLVGEFNSWERPGIPLSKQTERRYAAQLELESGIYEYKILRIINGEEEWIELSEDAMTVSDGFGGENGLIYID